MQFKVCGGGKMNIICFNFDVNFPGLMEEQELDNNGGLMMAGIFLKNGIGRRIRQYLWVPSSLLKGTLT